MSKKEKFPYRLLLLVLGVHMFTSILFNLLSNISHPLYNFVDGFPLVIQIIITSIFSFAIYLIPGYLIIISMGNKDELIKNIDRIMIVFALLLLISFIVSFAYTMILHSKQGWLIYSTTNSTSGLLIYNLFNKIASWWDLSWIITSFIPPLGMMMGMYMRLKREGLVK